MKIRFRRPRQAGPSAPRIWDALCEARDVPAELARLIGFAVEHAGISRSTRLQDVWALFENGGKRGGYFVEFGAADGITQSNTWMLAEHFGWTGALGEPHPEYARQLATNRPREYRTDKAIWSVTGASVTLALTRVPLLSVVVESDPPGLHRRKALQHKTISVATISLNDFLSEAQAPDAIDFMSVDVEGGELPILQAFDFDRWQVRCFCVERNRADAQLDFLFAAHGYRRRFPDLSGPDNWYAR